jgi:hypothetical protein
MNKGTIRCRLETKQQMQPGNNKQIKHFTHDHIYASACKNKETEDKDERNYKIMRIAHRAHHSSVVEASFHSVPVSHMPLVVERVHMHDRHAELKDQID